MPTRHEFSVSKMSTKKYLRNKPWFARATAYGIRYSLGYHYTKEAAQQVEDDFRRKMRPDA